MRYCDKCKLEIADEIQHCPLCGRNLSDTQLATQQFLCYPDNKIWFDKRNLIMRILEWIVLIGTLVCTAIELIIFHTVKYSWHVIAGALLAFFDIILPIKHRWCFSAVSTTVGISICGYILFLELFTHTFGWGLIYAIPFFILFMALYSTGIIFARNYYKGFEFVIPLLIFTILSITVFIFNYVKQYTYWPSLVAFLTATASFVFILIFRFKKVKEELSRSFFM